VTRKKTRQVTCLPTCHCFVSLCLIGFHSTEIIGYSIKVIPISKMMSLRSK